MPKGIRHDSMDGFYYDTLPPGSFMQKKLLELRRRFRGRRRGRPRRSPYALVNKDLAERPQSKRRGTFYMGRT